MRLLVGVLIAFLGTVVAGLRVTEAYTSYKLNHFTNQIYYPYLVRFVAGVQEEHAEASEASGHALIEQLLPVEFVREAIEMTDLESFSAHFGFGNMKLLAEQPALYNQLVQAGTTYKVFTSAKDTYRRFLKLMGGLFGAEVARPAAAVIEQKTMHGRSYFYHNSGNMPLNFVMFVKMIAFFNSKEHFALFNCLNVMETFKGDYVAFKLDFNRLGPKNFEVKLSVDFILRELILNNLFNTNNIYVPKAVDSSSFNGANLKGEGNLNGEMLRSYIKNSPSFLMYAPSRQAGDRRVKLSARNVKPVYLLQQKYVFDVENQESDVPLNFTLAAVFKPSEYPMLAEMNLTCKGNQSNIRRKEISYWQEPTDRIPGHIVKFHGILDPKTTLKIEIPYQQVHKNFEFVESDHLIANVLPSSLFEYTPENGAQGSQESVIVGMQNVAFKTKNYDTTMVFAVISVYLVIFCLAFNSIVKITEDEEK